MYDSMMMKEYLESVDHGMRLQDEKSVGLTFFLEHKVWA